MTETACFELLSLLLLNSSDAPSRNNPGCRTLCSCCSRLASRTFGCMYCSIKEIEMLACWIDLLVPYCGDYTEANAWTKEELSKYNHFMSKRKYMEEIENKNIEELITSKEYLNKNSDKYSKSLSQKGILINNVFDAESTALDDSRIKW